MSAKEIFSKLLAQNYYLPFSKFGDEIKRFKYFLSSTYVDLKIVREKVIKFLGVLKSDLINMEIFGSDEHTPKEYCLQKVQESNFFIGIYAERYGTIDAETQRSLTELEYDSALSMYNEGKLHGLLLYIIAEDSSWPIKFIEKEQIPVERLGFFKNKLKSTHAISFFSDPEELPFNILRDTISKLEKLSGSYFKKNKIIPIRPIDKLETPIGMEFFKPDMSNFFYGRNEDIRDLKSQIINCQFSLLIGVSGIGKTSLLNAGILNDFNALGWITAIIRPLNNATKNLKNYLWNQLFEGSIPGQFDFEDVVKLTIQENSNKHILIVIDQFEDILYDKRSIDEVTFSLLQIYSLKSPFIHVLISYRGDVESDLGNIWQKISGANDGLPRYYLRPLTVKGAKIIIDQSLQNLNIIIHQDDLLDRIVSDVEIESKSAGYDGVFPPFVQMIISTIHIVAVLKKGISNADYIELGECRGILSDYLLRQLDHLGSTKDQGIKILVSLVNNYGTKTQKTIEEISFETKIDVSNLNLLLPKLIDLRLARSFDGVYEITHDLLAKIVLKGLMSEDEQSIRQFIFLLESKAAAYKTTTADLTLLEHLHLYKYRSRVNCSSKNEMHLFINSALSNGAPIVYWLNCENISSINKDLMSKLCFFLNGLIFDNRQHKIEINTEEINLVKASLSDAEDRLLIFERGAINQGDHLNALDIRKLISSKKRWQEYQGLILLGIKGQKSDIDLLKKVLQDENHYGKAKPFDFKSFIKLCLKYRKYEVLLREIVNYQGAVWSSFVDDTAVINSKLAPELFRNILVESKNLSAQSVALLSLSKIYSNDELPELMAIIDNVSSKEGHNSLLIEQFWNLCVGSTIFPSFMSYVKMILACDFDLGVRYDLLIHEKISVLATIEDYSWLKQYVINENKIIALNDSNPDFFNEYHFDKITNTANRYFISWIACGGFCQLATDEDKGLVLDLLKHKLWTVRNYAVKTLYRIGNEQDIDYLLNLAFEIPDNKEILKAICVLDNKAYGLDIKDVIGNTTPKFHKSPQKVKKHSNKISISQRFYPTVYQPSETIDDLPF